jgi:antitoxin component YwqK of YwqJK toxin-antitoxin module
MKRLLAPILLLTLLFPSLAYGVTFWDLVERDGLHYVKFTDVPFTGKTTGEVQGTFRNGKKHGLWVAYHDNGQLLVKGTFKNGKRDGPWVFYKKWGQKDITGNNYHQGSGTYRNGKKISN